MKRVLVLANVSELSPAFRYRIYNTLQFLEKENKVHLDTLTLYSNKTMKVLGTTRQIIKVVYVVRDMVFFLKEFKKREKEHYDVVIIKSNVFPIGGATIEKWCKKNLSATTWIYDIDDAIYLNTTRKENKIFSCFRDLRSKVEFWVKCSTHVLISNNIIYEDLRSLYDLSRDRCSIFLSAPYRNQYFLPTEDIGKEKDLYRFVWLGSPHTQKNLKMLNKFVHEIHQYIPDAVVVLIGTDENFNLYRELPWVIFIEWTPENEVFEMRRASFGLNPLYDEAFHKRKSAFKAIQYYRAGIIPLVSDVGINRELIQTYGGYCTNDFQDLDILFDYIKRMIENIAFERKELMRKTQSLSVESNARLIEKLL